MTFEGLYYSDILRWKTAEKENNGMMHNYDGIEVVKRSFNPKRDYLWPIPYNQTVLNPIGAKSELGLRRGIVFENKS